MFTGQRFATQGVMEVIPPFLQLILWYAIETMEVEKKDYLQVFTLSGVWKDGKLKQKITHSQEEPTYVNENIITVISPINAKVFVMDDGDHCTMMLAEEY